MVPYLVVGRSDFHFRCGTLDFAVTPTQGVGQAGLVEGQPDRLPPGGREPAAHGVDALQVTLKLTVTVPPAGTFTVWGLALVTVQLAATLEGVSCTW